jgi:hypothetical protein
MDKIPFEQWKNSMSFVIDDEFDNSFLGSISGLTKLINTSCNNFSDPDKLSEFITSDSPLFPSLMKFKAFVSLIGLSEERLKRVVSLVRFKFFDEDFNTEWDVSRINKTIINNIAYRKLLLEFFIKGRNSAIGSEIPLYYMRNFRLLDPSFIKDLSDYNYVERILNDNEVQGKYSNSVGSHVESIISKKLDNYKATKNPALTYERTKEFKLLNKNIDFLIPNVNDPIILIESSYNITTGSGQSKRADQLVDFYSTLMINNANQRSKKIIMVNYCDGFGWVGRQNDLRRIYEASDYVINQTHLTMLDDILDIYIK